MTVTIAVLALCRFIRAVLIRGAAPADSKQQMPCLHLPRIKFAAISVILATGVAALFFPLQYLPAVPAISGAEAIDKCSGRSRRRGGRELCAYRRKARKVARMSAMQAPGFST
jgi:hypothetical protein